MCEVVGFDIHRGLLAVGVCEEIPPVKALLASLPERATVLVLEGLTDHDNVGACFRNAAGLGADAVLLDDRCCMPLYRKSIRVSVGHALSVPFCERTPMPELIEALKAEGFECVALSLQRDAEALDSRRRPSARLALLLGSEGPGLTPQTIAAADRNMYIPMAEGVDSLNVAVAGAVALFALTGGE
jgi:tRNA G18 (ribose-2'-O)-methylase SpoU